MGFRAGRRAPAAPAAGDAEHWDGFVTGGAYGLLFLLGAVQAAIGCFQYSYSAGPVPVAALGCCAAILVTCLLGGWAMRSLAGALVPALGWVIVSFILSMPDTQGSVIITNTSAGKWYLYGGALSAALGVVAAFAIWGRPRPGAQGRAGRR